MHGAWCGSHTWPTRCHRCSASIFYFGCECGSRVLFDELGPPWPRHDCDRSWSGGLTRTVTDSGEVRVALASDVTAVRPGPSFDVEEDALRRVVSRKASPDPIIAMDPPPGAREEVLGVLREVTVEVDPHTKLGVARSTMGAAALGPMGHGPMGRITVHTSSPEEDDLIESFTSWVPTQAIEDLKRDVTVSVVLESVSVLGVRSPVWFCSALTVVS